MELPELSPDEFTWERLAREIRDRCLGYCDGSKLRIRPKSDMVAIMLEDDEFEKFWFHYPKFAFEKDVLDKWND